MVRQCLWLTVEALSSQLSSEAVYVPDKRHESCVRASKILLGI